MEEEIGKAYPIQKVISFIYGENDNKEIVSVFVTKAPISPEELVLDSKEIQYLSAFTYEELVDLITGSPKECSPTLAAVIKVLSGYPQSMQPFQSAN